ncbi:hypothetical protein CLV92_10977 [Kineococcus xinjiangensis]|uniref:Htaa protein n=1 Tax=Kineococcus xinjiangensis TaxID=512762 RepID=A0A2S6IHY2_9ACTN|nr:hypothetical protein [Kineococcus xinjiangensis]PPK93801.1 hypothetical protein CLV92_10977 [Kineococcus xinjiangensis]
MSVRTTLTAATAALVLPGVLVATAGQAAAAPKDSASSKRTVSSAFVDWTEEDRDNVLGLPGNVHVGFLKIKSTTQYTKVWGQIIDFECAPGELPGGHGEESTCEHVQVRYLDSSDMTLVVDTRAGTAKATGEITVSNGGHGEPGEVLAVVPATIDLRSTTPMASFTRTETWTDGSTSYRSRVRGTASGEVIVGGALGRMGFADDADDVSYGSFEKYTEISRERVG